jgi:hypothetical protein
MANQSTAEDRLIDRRSVLRTGVALAAAGPALLHAEHAKAQPRPDGASPTTIIDAQVHAYAANTPERPWHSVPNWPPHVTSDEMVVANAPRLRPPRGRRQACRRPPGRGPWRGAWRTRRDTGCAIPSWALAR